MKGNILQGTARGRMGDIVAKVVHGVQIYSKYQPNVTQSNSELVIQTKQKFKYAVDFTKEAKKTASIKLPYSVYLGSAKNMRSALIQQSLLAYDCFDINGIGFRQSKPRQNRLFYKDLQTNWGNKFEVEISATGEPHIVRAFSGNTNFFGSDIPLNDDSFDFRTIVINTIKPENEHSLIEFVASSKDNLELTPVLAGIQNEGKNLGIYQSVEECGVWNFYYKFSYSGLLSSGIPADINVKVGENIQSAKPGAYQCAHFMVVNRNTLLSYDFEENFIAPKIDAPAP